MYGQLRQRGQTCRSGTPGPSPSLRKGGYRTVGGVEKFSADWQRAVRLGRWSREVSSAVENRPLLPPIQVVQPENFSFIKRKEEQVSQNPSSRRGPHRAASQGMFRDFGEPGPSSGAGGAYGGPAQTPTSGQQKFHLVPSINAVSGSQDLQWMVQPHFLGPSSYPRPLTYPQYSPPQPRPGVIRALGPPPGVRRRPCEQISPEEEERRRVRRERNKLAAAKCRNRRKELTDFLQAETDKLEDEKSGLQREIEELQKQKERLELVLEAHRPICKIPEGATESDTGGAGGPSSPPATSGPVPCISLSSGPVLEPEALHTPTLMTTPSLTPFTPSPVFTYPSTPEPCASAHRRSSSSSGDPSSDPLGSPTLLAL